MTGQPEEIPASTGPGPVPAGLILEQYKLFAESADRVSDRRMTTNNLLLTANALIASAAGVSPALALQGFRQLPLILPLVGLAVCGAWWALVANYRRLNRAKFAVIQDLEGRLPSAPFTLEWKEAQSAAVGVYRPVSHLEQWIPAVFAAVYLGLLFAVISDGFGR